jgi:hypothetical protein
MMAKASKQHFFEGQEHDTLTSLLHLHRFFITKTRTATPEESGGAYPDSNHGSRTCGVFSHSTVQRGPPSETMALPSQTHNQLLQRDSVHARQQARVSV